MINSLLFEKTPQRSHMPPRHAMWQLCKAIKRFTKDGEKTAKAMNEAAEKFLALAVPNE